MRFVQFLFFRHALVDTSRNGILNMMLSDSAENTAQTIQADIDANRPQS